jgi:hypothetical protein
MSSSSFLIKRPITISARLGIEASGKGTSTAIEFLSICGLSHKEQRKKPWQ